MSKPRLQENRPSDARRALAGTGHGDAGTGHGGRDYFSSRRAWYLVAVLSVAVLLSFTDRLVLNLLVADIRSDLGLGDLEVSLLQGLGFAFIYAIVGLPMGRIADRTNRRNLVILGICTWSAATLAAVASLATLDMADKKPVWEAIVRLFAIPAYLLPGPESVFMRVVHDAPQLIAIEPHAVLRAAIERAGVEVGSEALFEHRHDVGHRLALERGTQRIHLALDVPVALDEVQVARMREKARLTAAREKLFSVATARKTFNS